MRIAHKADQETGTEVRRQVRLLTRDPEQLPRRSAKVAGPSLHSYAVIGVVSDPPSHAASARSRLFR